MGKIIRKIGITSFIICCVLFNNSRKYVVQQKDLELLKKDRKLEIEFWKARNAGITFNQWIKMKGGSP